MTSDYDYNNLPRELEAPVLPEELLEDAQAAFVQAIESGLAKATEIKAVHVFNRKGYMDANSFVGRQNPSYRSDSDDVILQMTIRIPNPKREKTLSGVAALEDRATEYTKEAERKRLEAELAKAEADATQAETTAREARAKLEALRKK